MSRRMIGLALVVGASFASSAAAPGCNVVVGAGDYKVGAPAPTGCSAEPIADKVEPIIKACMLFFGCTPLPPNMTLSFCTTFNVPKTSAYFSCSLTANTCQEISDCRGVSYPNAGDCDGTTNEVKCVGNRAVSCISTFRNGGYFFNCDVLGGTCATYKDGGNDAAGCSVSTCTGTSATYACNGQNLYQCYDGVGIGENCAKSSATCATKSGQTSCFFNKPPCDADSISCDGDTINYCTSNSLITYGCGALGEKCEATDKDANCLAPNCNVADWDSCQETCDADGVTAVLCIGGAKMRVDCTKYGFTKCTKFDKSASISTPYVLCQQ